MKTVDVELELFASVVEAERRFSRNFLGGGRGEAGRGEAVHAVMRRKSPANLIPARFIWSYFISAFDAALGRHAFKIHYTLAGRAAVTEGGKEGGGGVQR